MKGRLLFIALSLLCVQTHAKKVATKQVVHRTRYDTCTKELVEPRMYKQTPVKNFFGNIFRTVFDLHINLASFDTFRIIPMVFPSFIALRMADERIHSHFYDPCCHKNINKSAFFNHDVAQQAIALPIIALASLSIFAKDDDLKITSRVFTVGMPFVILAKDAIKELRFKAAYRPYSQYFEKKRVCGGFPSGHMAEMMYMTVLYGMRHGIKFALPLSALSFYVGATFVACNRHYASQIAAGAGLGAIYAVAASRVIDQKLEFKRLKDLKLGFDMTCNGEPAMSMNYRF